MPVSNDPSDLGDPTNPNTVMPRKLEDQIAELVVRCEEYFDAEGWLDKTPDTNEAASVLDVLERPDIAEWLDKLRRDGRARFRKFAVRG